MPNVGIGTTTPGEKLDVKGTIAISGATSGAVKFAVPAAAGSATYTWPAAAPGSNMVLQSSSAGVLSWVSGGGGGTPAGSDTQIQFNSSGVFGASSSLTFDGTFLATPVVSSSIILASGYVRSTGSGTAAIPALQIQGAGGFFSTGANQLSIATNSAERMRFDASGNVGIGTTTPGEKLDVKGTVAISGATSGAVKFAVPAVAGSATYTWPAAAPGSNMVLQSDAAGVLSWVAAGSGTGDFKADGTVNATDTLNLAAGALGTGGVSIVGDPDTGIVGAAANTISIMAGGSEAANFGSSVNNLLRKTNMTDGTAALPALSFSADPNTGIYRIGTDTIGFSTNGTEAMRLDSGNVTVAGRMVASAFTDADALSAVTLNFRNTNMIRATAASGACGSLDFTNVGAGGSYTVTIPNATATCTSILMDGSATNVKLPSGYGAGGVACAGVVYTAIYDGTTLWVSYVPF